MFRLTGLLLGILLLLPTFARAQAAQGGDSLLVQGQDLPGEGPAAPEESSRRWAGLPVLGYSPETHLIYGAAGLRFFGGGGSTRSSRLAAIVIYTQEKQFSTGIEGDIYIARERARIVAGLGYSKFPLFFYGIGRDSSEEDEESYTPEEIAAEASLLWRLREGWRLGPRILFQDQRILEREAGGLLDAADLPGSRRSRLFGLGLQTSWDSRDQPSFPQRGSYALASGYASSDSWGSDLSFEYYEIDLRRYMKLGERRVLALRGIYGRLDGAAPFSLLATLGGDSVQRGYYQGRYRDRQRLVFQAEYRRRNLWGRFGWVAFAAAGDVAPRLDRLWEDGPKLSGGLGLRYLFVKEELLHLRLDLGFGEGSSGVYIAFDEAF